jgi:hypothetical protein
MALRLLSLLLSTTSITVQGLVLLPTTSPRLPFTSLSSSVPPHSDSDDGESLRDRALKLRQEAELLQQQVSAKRLATAAATPSTISAPPIITQLADSIWTLSYRFSSQPKPKDEDDDDGILIPNYSGKLTLKLKRDGYSDLISHESTGNQPPLVISKIWGWDQEDSQTTNAPTADEKETYLLLSMDVTLPATDPKLPSVKERYYLEARIGLDQDLSKSKSKSKSSQSKAKAITLQQGTITVKKDISERTKGVWGFFSVAGILTEFRYVGDFSARPSREGPST